MTKRAIFSGSATRKKSGTILALSLVGVLGLSACSGGGSSSGGDGGASHVAVAQGVDPTTMDPINQRETPTVNVLQHLYDPLIRFDPEDPSKYVPALAKAWTQVDELTWEFELEEGVTFSDGSDFNADDVVASVDYLLGDAQPLQISSFPGLEKAVAVDDYTVQLVTRTPDPLMMPSLPGLFIIPDDADIESLASEPIGTGPYTLKSWERNASVDLVARDGYFMGDADIQEVEFQTIPDAAARLANLNSGSSDIISALSPDNIPEVEAAGLAHEANTPSVRVAALWLNTLEEGPLQDKRVRQAMNYAVDNQTIIDTVMGGYGEQIPAFTPEFFRGYFPDHEPFSYDQKKAKDLLAEAGYADGFETTMMIAAGRMPFGEEMAQAVQSYLAEVGITVNLDIVEFGVFADRTNSGDVDGGYFAGYGNQTYNPFSTYQVAAVTGGGVSLYSNPEFDQIVTEGTSTVDDAAEEAAMKKAEELLLEEAPFLYLYEQVDIYGVSDRLDWEPQPDESIYLYDATVKE